MARLREARLFKWSSNAFIVSWFVVRGLLLVTWLPVVGYVTPLFPEFRGRHFRKLAIFSLLPIGHPGSRESLGHTLVFGTPETSGASVVFMTRVSGGSSPAVKDYVSRLSIPARHRLRRCDAETERRATVALKTERDRGSEPIIRHHLER
jgi:hypothetical protein